MIIAPGSTSQSLIVSIFDDSGLPVLGLLAATFPPVFWVPSGGARVAFPALSDLALITSPWVAGGVKEAGGGDYRLDAFDTMFPVKIRGKLNGEAAGKHLLYEWIIVDNLASAAVVAPGGLGLASLSPDLAAINSRAYLISTGVTVPPSADQWAVGGFFNAVPYYASKATGLFCWYNGAAWVISAAVGVVGAASWLGGASAGGSSSAPVVYAPQGTATGSASVVAHGNAVLSTFQPDIPFPARFGSLAIDVGGNVSVVEPADLIAVLADVVTLLANQILFPRATVVGSPSTSNPSVTSVSVTGLAATDANEYQGGQFLLVTGARAFAVPYKIKTSSFALGITTLTFDPLKALPVPPVVGDQAIVVGGN